MQFLKFTFFFLLICAKSVCFAQDVLYTEYEKFDFRSDEYVVAGMSGGKLYIYTSVGASPQLNAYDDSMNKIATVLLDFFPAKIYEVRFITYPDKIIALYQALEGGKVIQYAALLDETGRLKSKPLELGSVKTGIFGATRSYFEHAISDNKRALLVYSAEDRSDGVELECKWLDDNLTLIKKTKATYKTDNRAEHGEVNIANDGTVFMVAYTTTGAHNYADRFWLLQLRQGGNKFEPKEVYLDDKFVASGTMKIDNQNAKVFFSGFYSDKKNGSFDGIIYTTYDRSDSAKIQRKFIPFDRELIKVAGIRHRQHPFDDYFVKHLIVKNDGGFVLVSELQYVTTRSTYTPGFGYYSFYSPYTNSTVHEYHYEDILSLSYNKEGEREWSSFIPKQQYSQEDGGVFSSFGLLNSGGTLAYLFNDFNVHHSRIQLATVSADGKTEVHGFTAEGNDYPDWIPKSAKQVSARSMVVPCLHKKQICFAKVQF